jgi:hypothetical protein
MIVDANKCQITKHVIDILNSLHWGVNCRNNNNAIYDNYIGYLDCSTVLQSRCYPDTCLNETTNLVCTMSITGIDYTIGVDGITATFNINNLSGYEEPLTYLWEFDNEVFTTTSSINGNTLVLTIKDDKTFDTIVSPITLTITDNNGCKVVKTCYVTPEGMVCTEEYSPCSNPKNLIIMNTFVNCQHPTGLVVINS